jgi:hypothetical protein
MNKKKNRSQFKTIAPIKKIARKNIHFLEVLKKIVSREIQEGIIGYLPHNKGDLYIDTFKIHNIFEKHGKVPLENLILTVTEPTAVICGIIENMPYITLIYELEETGFVLSARKFNGHYVVTFFESLDLGYIESIKRRNASLL